MIGSLLAGAVLILLPPSEGKADPRRGKRLDLDDLGYPALVEARSRVLAALVDLCSSADTDAAARTLGIGPTQTDEVRRNATLRTSPTARADAFYTGVLYDSLDFASLDAASRRRATRSLAITSSLFGLVVDLRSTTYVRALLESGVTPSNPARLADHIAALGWKVELHAPGKHGQIEISTSTTATTISSKLSPNASTAPATRDDLSSGNVTTMQNVASPTMIVNSPALIPNTGCSRFWIIDCRATPVTMPGSAIGRITSRLITRLPKKSKRVSARASSAPSASAMAVAPRPAFTDIHNASLGPCALNAADHHWVVNDGGGQPKVRSELNELSVTIASGT